MSINLGSTLPDPLVDLLSGDNLPEKVGLAYLLISRADDEYPHPCIVSPGEVVALDPSTLRLALYPDSTASRNLLGHGATTLCLAYGGVAYYVKATAEPLAIQAPALAGLAVFTLRLHAVLEDRDPNAEVTTGFGFRDPRGDQAVVTRWEPVVAALRTSPPGQVRA